MPKHTHSPGERWRLRTPRRIFRWLLRFLGWSLVVGFAGIFVVVFLASIIYFNRARIVNDTLDYFVEPFDVSVGEIHINDIGTVHIEDLHLSPKNSGVEHPMVEIPHVRLTYDFDRLRRNQVVETIALEKPKITIRKEFLDALPRAGANPGTASLDLSAFAYFTQSLEVEDGALEISLKGLPTIQSNWNLSSGPLQFSDEGQLLEPVTLQLQNVSVGGDAGGGIIESVSATATFEQDLSRIDIPELLFSGIEADVTPEWFAKADKEANREIPPETTEPAVGADLHFGKIQIGQSSISATGFDGSTDAPAFPDVSFETEIEFIDVSHTNGRWHSPAPLTVAITNVAVGATQSQLASVDRIGIRLDSPGELIHEQKVSEIEISGIDLVVADRTMTRLASGKKKETAGPASEDEKQPWILESLRIEDGALLVQNLTIDGKPAPRIQSSLSGAFEDLQFGGKEGFTSNGLQSLILEQASLRSPGVRVGNKPLLTLAYAEVEGRWSDFNFDNRIGKLILRGPKINFSDESLGNWLYSDGEEKPVGPANRPVYKVSELEVTGGRVEADSQFAEGLVPKIYSDFTIHTDHSDQENPFLYQLNFQDFNLRNHPVQVEFEGPPAPPSLFPDRPTEPSVSPVAEEEVFAIKSIEVKATANQLQRTRKVENVLLDGAVIRIGSGLKSIVDAGAEKTPGNTEDLSTAQPPTDLLPTWTLEKVQITRSQVRFEALIPQVEGLEFDIETTLTDVPLSPDELLSQANRQKIELAGIEIKDPYDSFITVATLPTIFVEFSLAGLANQEVERIDLIGPSLHVGQGLFWWIDYQRNFRKQNEGASIEIDDSGTTAPPGEETPDWVIKTINATAGKIIIAPTGVPIGMVPFPFNATTSMLKGKTELKLTIPDEDYVYRFPDYKVDLYGLTGNVEFNVPVEDVNNNLVQTFNLDRLIWKKYEAEKLYLTVTFDEDGIYGSLGGDAYGGYAEGGFNFYLNDPGKWDAWIAGTDMDAFPITQALAPENFQMEGPISLKVVSEGRDKSVGVTTGEFQTGAPGWFDIKKFDAIIEEFPSDWSGLQSSLAELGLVAVKRFDYDKGSGSLYLSGRNGKFDLRFAGPYGTRKLTFHLHDKRNTQLADAESDAPEASAEQDPPPQNNADNTPIPEASARPVASRTAE
ncbi:MAG: hypothetical protein P1U87_20470 [Verrucomicrobiales bacterium]|nr:hypothetical protein [Verrucomicrobiales bacterium]